MFVWNIKMKWGQGTFVKTVLFRPIIKIFTTPPVLWPPHAKSWLIGKDSDAGKDWGWEKGTTEVEMAGWHHWLDGCDSEWTLGVGYGTGRPGLLRFMGSQRAGHDWVTFTFTSISSVAQWCPTLWDLMDCSMQDFPVNQQLAQTHVHHVSDVT